MKKIFILFSLLALALNGFSQAGQLDSTFNLDGIAIFTPGADHDNSYKVVAMPDTSSYICGTTSVGNTSIAFVMHVNKNGTQDNSFGTSGLATFAIGDGNFGYDLKVQPDGKIILVGTFYDSIDTKAFVSRYTATGQLDLSFNTTGYRIVNLSTNDDVFNTVALQSNGKIVIAGNTNQQCLFMRLNSDGSLDNTFGLNSVKKVDATIQEEDINDLVILNSGSIIGAGYGYNAGLFATVTMYIKLDANGSLMNSFDFDGILFPGIAPNNVSACNGLALKNNEVFGTGYISTSTDIQAYVSKMDTSGVMSNGFGNLGLLIITPNVVQYGYDIVLQSDNKILICGQVGPGGFGSNKDLLLARIDPSGILDIGFGINGIVSTSASPLSEVSYGIALQPDGKILTTGVANFSLNDVVMARYKNAISGTPTSLTNSTFNQINIFPNPTEDIIYLDKLDENVTYELYNTLGQGVQKGLLNIQRFRNGISISTLPTGIYTLVLNMNHQKSYYKIHKK